MVWKLIVVFSSVLVWGAGSARAGVGASLDSVMRFPFPGLELPLSPPPALAWGNPKVIHRDREACCLFGDGPSDEGGADPEDEDGASGEEIAYFPWALGFHAGYAASTGIDEVIVGSASRHRGDVYTGFSILRQFRSFEFLRLRLRFELELNQQLVFESARDKKPYGQTNLFLSLRFLGDKLPWSEALLTSFAIGEGISYSSRIPDVERVKNGADDVGRWLNFLMFELAAKSPSSRLTFYFRLSHRSGGSGYLASGDVEKGSNLLLFGVRIGLGRAMRKPPRVGVSRTEARRGSARSTR